MKTPVVHPYRLHYWIIAGGNWLLVVFNPTWADYSGHPGSWKYLTPMSRMLTTK